MRKALGEELRRVREAAGLSQEAVAKAAKITRVYVSMLEGGKKSPTLDVFVRVAKALGEAPSKLLERVEKLN